MAYVPTKWENEPSTKTPLNAENLNKLEQGVKKIHDMADNGQFKGDKGEKGDKGDTGAKGATGTKGDKGDPGKDGVAVITTDSVGYGLSASEGKVELGRGSQYWRIIDTPEGDVSLLIGRLDESGVAPHGFVKMKGYLRMVEGDAFINIQDDMIDDLRGASPMADGKNRVNIKGYRSSLLGEQEIFLSVSNTSQFKPSIRIDENNTAHSFNDTWDTDTAIVNNKKLMEEINKLTARIEALEVK